MKKGIKRRSPTPFSSLLPHLFAPANTKPGCTFAAQVTTSLCPAAQLETHTFIKCYDDERKLQVTEYLNQIVLSKGMQTKLLSSLRIVGNC